MAQVPATPKAKRLLILTTRALFGTRTTRRLFNLQKSEQLALSLGDLPRPTEKPTCVTFLIPLVKAADVQDWDAVQTRLNQTLSSLQVQSNPNWQVFIACQNRPTLPDDPRIHHLPFTQSGQGNDKWEKLGALAKTLQSKDLPAGYVMSFDADDLLASDAVETMLSPPAPTGHLIVKGYVKDVSTGDTALAQNAFRCRPFWKLCGSCAAFRYDNYSPQFADAYAAILQHEHRMFPYLAKLARRPLQPFKRPMALYLLNHGDNFGARRGRVGFKTRFVQRFKILDKTMLEDVQARFPHG